MFQTGACYIRVSTDEQTEFSPDAQLKAIKKYAMQNNIHIINEHIYTDEGISGKRADKRPQFMKMIAASKSDPKPFDVILVHKFDRFARSREDSVVYKSLLKKEAGIKVISVTESIEDDKFSVILEAMLEAMAEYYSLNLADEVKKGMTEKAERGEFQSSPAFGYKAENNQLVPVPQEAQIVRLIFQKYASRKISVRQLAIYINRLGVKTKRGNPFESRTIEYMLNNPIYIGKIRWTPTGKMKRNFHHPDIMIRDGTHEPVIDMDLWEQVQLLLKENKEIYRKGERTATVKKTWLSGIVRCAHCGKTLVSNGKIYLQCNGYVKGQCDKSCHTAAAVLEDLVLEEIRQTYAGSLDITIIPKSSDFIFISECNVLKERISKLNVKKSRMKAAYLDGVDTLDEYKEHKTKIENERYSLINELKSLEEKSSHINCSDGEKIKKPINVYALLTDESINMELKYKIAHLLIDEITYSKELNLLKITYK